MRKVHRVFDRGSPVVSLHQGVKPRAIESIKKNQTNRCSLGNERPLFSSVGLRVTFDYCRKHDIELYRNTRLHLKVIWDLGSSAFLGSANISRRGIESKSNDFNWELNKVANNLSIEDQQYLQSRLLESEIITVERMLALKAHKNAIAYQEPIIPEIEFPNMTDDHFLITQLLFIEMSPRYLNHMQIPNLCVSMTREIWLMISPYTRSLPGCPNLNFSFILPTLFSIILSSSLSVIG